MATSVKSDITVVRPPAQTRPDRPRPSAVGAGSGRLRREEPRRLGSLGAPLHGNRAQGLDGDGAALGNLGRPGVRARAARRRSALEPTSSSSAVERRRSRRGSPARASGPSPSTSHGRSSTSLPRLQQELGLSFPLIHANAEDVPYDSESFDLVVSEYGASLWCEPHRWLAEADRLLRPGGGLVFVTNSPLLMACTPEDGERAGRPAPARLLHEPGARVPGRRRRVPPDARRAGSSS